MTLLTGRLALRIQAPLAVSDHSEPEPDVAVVLPGDCDTEHPGTALLVIEVSDTTLKRDRRKAGLYASAGVPEYWIVNLRDRTVEVRTRPLGGDYAELHTARAGDLLRPVAVGDFELAVDAILPKADARQQ